MELPKNQGWYLKRGVIYLAIRVQREKFVFATEWRIDDPAVTLRKLDDFKKEKIAEASKQLGLSKIQRNLTVSALFKRYVAHLKKNEQKKGEYVTEERTNSDRAEPQIKLHLEPVFGKLRPKDVAGNLEQYQQLRVKEGASPATINGEFRLLRAALRRGWKDDKVRGDHLPKEYPFDYEGERNSARSGDYTDDQIQGIVDHATPQFKVVFMTMVYTGLRPKEARWVERDDVLLDDPVDDAPRILVGNHKTAAKTNKPKIVALVDQVLPTLKDWEAETKRDYPDCQWFFHLNGKRFGADTLDTEWERVVKACGLPKGTILYDARRTASNLLDEHGVNKDDRKTQMGHDTDEMATLYNAASIAHVKRIREAFGAKSKPVSTPEPPPAPAPFDWKAELKDLKEALDAGLLPEALYNTEAAAVMQRRQMR